MSNVDMLTSSRAFRATPRDFDTAEAARAAVVSPDRGHELPVAAVALDEPDLDLNSFHLGSSAAGSGVDGRERDGSGRRTCEDLPSNLATLLDDFPPRRENPEARRASSPSPWPTPGGRRATARPKVADCSTGVPAALREILDREVAELHVLNKSARADESNIELPLGRARKVTLEYFALSDEEDRRRPPSALNVGCMLWDENLEREHGTPPRCGAGDRSASAAVLAAVGVEGGVHLTRAAGDRWARVLHAPWVRRDGGAGRSWDQRPNVGSARGAARCGDGGGAGGAGGRRHRRVEVVAALAIAARLSGGCRSCEASGGRLESLTEPVGTTTSTGRFTREMLAELTAFESERIGDTWRETHRRRQSLGLPHSGAPRLGYIYDVAAKSYSPDPDTAPVLRDLYRKYAGGEGCEALADLLLSIGVTSPTTRTRWTRGGVKSILDAGFGADFLRIHVPECTQHHESTSRCQRRVLVPGAQEPVI